MVKALDHILSYAFEQRASDIHFEPKRELTLVRLRIDGILHDVHLIPKIVYQAVVSRIKLLSGCNLAEKRRPQDGRIKREQGGREVELRVSTMPTAFGEKAVLRIFDPDILLKGIDELGLSDRDLPKFYDFIARPTGIILVTGPTGSGKTTTLYSVLKHLSKPEVNIVTIEDPIEMVFEDFNQVAVRPQIDITFSSALRTVLRQDPDIIMVGEIRDTETAEHAVQAALTGHLVLSTLHTNDAPAVGDAPARPRHPPLPDHHHAHRHHGPAAGARELHALPGGVRPHRRTRRRCCACPREAAEVPLQARPGLPALPRRPATAGAPAIFEVLPMTDKVRALVTAEAGAPEHLQGRVARKACARCARRRSRRSSAASPPPPRWCASPASDARDQPRRAGSGGGEPSR